MRRMRPETEIEVAIEEGEPPKHISNQMKNVTNREEATEAETGNHVRSFFFDQCNLKLKIESN